MMIYSVIFKLHLHYFYRFWLPDKVQTSLMDFRSIDNDISWVLMVVYFFKVYHYLALKSFFMFLCRK